MSAKAGDFPQLPENDFTFTQQIGVRVQKEGHPGLLAPSARLREESNVVLFNPEVLSNVRNHCYLTNELDPHAGQVVVSRQEGKTFLTLTVDQLFL